MSASVKTTMNQRSVLTMAVSIIVAIAVLGLVVLVPGTPSKVGGTSVTATGASLSIVGDELTVGFESGLWNMTLVNSGNVGVTKIMAVLATPTQTEVCTGILGGVSFKNCPATQVDPIAPGTRLSAYASGAGPGSATVGDSYTVTVVALFSNGQSTNMTSTVVAQSA